MRVIALLAVYNEERFIAGCLEHLVGQSCEVYLIDNESTDRTVAIAERYRGKGLIDIEMLPRAGVFNVRRILERKEVLATQLSADWFMHCDADEIRLPPRRSLTLAQAFEDVQAQGYNAVNFFEFTFVPTLEAPDHDHPDYQRTMRWYYPYSPFSPHRLNAWRGQPGRVELAWSAGHQVRFPGLRMYPEPFPMRHYLFLSVPHAEDKYGERRHPPDALAEGWHQWRERLQLSADKVRLPRQTELRTYVSDDLLDPSAPRTRHVLDTSWPGWTGYRRLRLWLRRLIVRGLGGGR